jgi:aromatic ring-opening dioxygenase LigB subunit
MGNSCIKNTTIEKSNINDIYSINNKVIHRWPELQFKNIYIVATILQEKKYNVITTQDINYPKYPFQYDRVILYYVDGVVKNIPAVG